MFYVMLAENLQHFKIKHKHQNSQNMYDNVFEKQCKYSPISYAFQICMKAYIQIFSVEFLWQ